MEKINCNLSLISAIIRRWIGWTILANIEVNCTSHPNSRINNFASDLSVHNKLLLNDWEVNFTTCLLEISSHFSNSMGSKEVWVPDHDSHFMHVISDWSWRPQSDKKNFETILKWLASLTNLNNQQNFLN